jgi:hypothetical protein
VIEQANRLRTAPSLLIWSSKTLRIPIKKSLDRCSEAARMVYPVTQIRLVIMRGSRFSKPSFNKVVFLYLRLVVYLATSKWLEFTRNRFALIVKLHITTILLKYVDASVPYCQASNKLLLSHRPRIVLASRPRSWTASTA